MLPIDELLEPTTFEEAKATIYSVLEAIGVPTTSWKPGAVVRTIISATAAMLAGASALHSRIGKSTFLESARGGWLDLVGAQRYGVTRREATFATGDVTVTNAGAGIYNFDPGELQLLNTATGKTYQNTGAISLGASSTITDEFQATEAGSDSNALPGEIDALVVPLANVTCSNTLALQALDREEDETYVVSAKEGLGALSPMGPWDAYSYVAKHTLRNDGTLIGVAQVKTTHDGAGNVTTYVTGPAGPLTGGDLADVDSALQRQAVPLGITATTVNADYLPIDVAGDFWIYSTTNLTDAQLLTLVNTRLEAFFAARPIGGDVISGGGGGKVYLSALESTIGGTRSEIFRVTLTSPTGDTAIAQNELPTIGTVTLTVHQVLPGRDI